MVSRFYISNLYVLAAWVWVKNIHFRHLALCFKCWRLILYFDVLHVSRKMRWGCFVFLHWPKDNIFGLCGLIRQVVNVAVHQDLTRLSWRHRKDLFHFIFRFTLVIRIVVKFLEDIWFFFAVPGRYYRWVVHCLFLWDLAVLAHVWGLVTKFRTSIEITPVNRRGSLSEHLGRLMISIFKRGQRFFWPSGG